jgi:hypothetical protein
VEEIEALKMALAKVQSDHEALHTRHRDLALQKDYAVRNIIYF